jgi:hypothetical protein
LPDDLKAKVIQLAQKKNMPLDTWIGYWLQTAVVQDETIEWMTRRLSGKNPEQLVAQFGKFLEKTKPGEEPTLDEIQTAMK